MGLPLLPEIQDFVNRGQQGRRWDERRYSDGMRVKTSITLPQALLEEIDSNGGNRSAFLERASRMYLAQTAKSGRNARDAALLDRRAEYL